MTSTSSPASILVRLKSETRSEHDAIEAALDLTQKTLTGPAYLRTLKHFYGFYRPLEFNLQATLGLTGHPLRLTERLKTPLLEADLLTLGIGFPHLLPVCSSLPTLSAEANCLGCLYVLEGSTLGGQVISRHLRQSIGVTPETGGRFFHSYGDRTGEMWQHFCATLTGFVTSPVSQDAAVAAAKDTFQKLHSWISTQG